MTQRPYGSSPDGAPQNQGYYGPSYESQYGGHGPQGYGTVQPVTAFPSGVHPGVRSPVMGAIGMVLVVLCGITMFWGMWQLGDVYGHAAADGLIDPEAQDQALPDAIVDQLTLPMLAVLASIVGGIAGWIVSIVATSQRRGRAMGIIGIIVGVIAPIAGFLAIFVGMIPHVAP